MFKIRYSLIHTRGCETVDVMNRSAKRGMALARREAWKGFYKSGATNWADVWLTIENAYGKVVYDDWAPTSAI